jgi:RNA polymerase sigma factor (sigma-70 family)
MGATIQPRKKVSMPMVHEDGVNSPATFACAQSGCGICLEGLLRQHEGLVHVIIRRSWVGSTEYDDLLQEGRIGLWRAICGYDVQRGVAFSTYAWPIIERQIWRAVAQNERQTTAPLSPWPQASDPEAAAIVAWQAAAVGAALEQALSHLSPCARQVMTAAYGLDGQPACSLAAIGRRYGVSRERVRQWRNDALVLLRLPAIAGQLAILTDQNTRSAYQRRQQLSQRWLRRRRGRGR